MRRSGAPKRTSSIRTWMATPAATSASTTRALTTSASATSTYEPGTRTDDPNLRTGDERAEETRRRP